MKDTSIYKNLENDKRVKAELKRLNGIYKDIAPDSKKLIKKLLDNAAFMGVLLEDLQADIKANGYKEKYQNGANQYGYKRSIAADLYQVVIKNYTAVIRQLNDLRPEEAEDDDADGFIAFINSRDR